MSDISKKIAKLNDDLEIETSSKTIDVGKTFDEKDLKGKLEDINNGKDISKEIKPNDPSEKVESFMENVFNNPRETSEKGVHFIESMLNKGKKKR